MTRKPVHAWDQRWEERSSGLASTAVTNDGCHTRSRARPSHGRTDASPSQRSEDHRDSHGVPYGVPWLAAAMRIAQEEYEQSTSCDGKRDGQQLREAAVKRRQAVHKRRQQDGWLMIRRTERADPTAGGKSGRTAGEKSGLTAG